MYSLHLCPFLRDVTSRECPLREGPLYLYYFQNAYLKPDLYEDIPSLCERSSTLISEIFINPDAIITRLIHNIYTFKLQVTVMAVCNCYHHHGKDVLFSILP